MSYSDHSERSEDVVLDGGVNGQEHWVGFDMRKKEDFMQIKFHNKTTRGLI